MWKDPIARSTVSTSFVLALKLLVQTGTLLIVARMFGPEQFGLFAAITALAVLFGAFSTFGTHLVLLGEASKNDEACCRILAYAVPTTLICGSLLFFVYISINSLLFKALEIPWFVFICIGLTEIVLLPMYLLPTIPLLADGRTAFSQFLTILPLVVRLIFAVLISLISFQNPLEVFSCGYLVVAVIALLCMKVYKKRGWLTLSEWRLASRKELKQSAGYATLALTALGPGELDKVLAVKLLPLGVSGLYAAAARVIGAATFPVIALLLSAMPRMFREAKINSVQNKKLLKWIFISVLVYGFILVGFLWCIAPVIEWLFGAKYTGFVEMLKLLSFAIPGLALRLTAGNVLMTLARPWRRVAFEISGIFVFTSITLLFYQYFLEKTLGIALICAEWSMAIIGLYMIKSSCIKFKFIDFIRRHKRHGE